MHTIELPATFEAASRALREMLANPELAFPFVLDDGAQDVVIANRDELEGYCSGWFDEPMAP